MAQDFDLDLGSLWFTKYPPIFPVRSMRLKGPSTSTYAYNWEEDGNSVRKVLICSVRWTSDFSITKVRLTWIASSSLQTIKTEQKHFPPPSPISPENLLKAYREYGPNIAAWAESSVDTTVGDGECWTFVHTALQDLAESYRKYGKEPPLLSQGRTHGYPILSLSAHAPGSLSGLLQLADVRRGDILQMTSAHFQTVTEEEEAPTRAGIHGTGEGEEEAFSRWRRKSAGARNVRMAHHTAVVVGVEGDALSVVEQNGGLPWTVARGRYSLH